MTPLRRAFLLWLALFGAYAATVGLPAAPGSRYTPEEAHVLLTAESIASDGDVDLRDEYRARAWRPWYHGALRPTAALTAGRLAEPQGIGFPALIAPAYAVGGPTAVQLWLAAIAALGFVVAAALARHVVPDPWATGAALVAGLSPPALAAATTVAPGMAGATVAAGAALLALRARDEPRPKWAFWCAALLGALPWLSVRLAAPAAVIAIALWRWLRRRQRGLAGFVALEVVLTSLVVYITVNDRIFGGLTPDAARVPGDSATGARTIADYLERAPRLVGLWVDRDVGLLRWAPFAALAFVGLGLLLRSRREHIAVALPERVHAEVAAALLAAVAGVVTAVAAFSAPSLHGAWLVAPELVPALPFGAALAAWGLRKAPRAGAALAVITVAGSLWVVVAGRVDSGAGVAPPRGALPWGGVERVLPRFGS